MAGIVFRVCSGLRSLTADAELCVLQLQAGSDQRVKVLGYSITIAGTAAVDILYRLVRQTGTGTASVSSGLIFPKTTGVTETLRTTARSAFSVNPTEDATPKLISSKYIKAGYEIVYPFGTEDYISGGGYLGMNLKSIGIGASAYVEFLCEE